MPSQIVAQAAWGIKNRSQIHYLEIRPMPLAKYKGHHLPLTTDCSGWVTCCYYAAGLPDPNGLGYTGQGYTGTLIDHLNHVSLADAHAGDLVVFGARPGVHVVILLEDGTANGGDPEVGSHGTEAGPVQTRLAAESAGFAGMPRTVLRGVPAEVAPARPTWEVRDHAGTLLAITHSPARWGVRHWRSYRKHREITYHRRAP